jgi:hypothetical protein
MHKSLTISWLPWRMIRKPPLIPRLVTFKDFKKDVTFAFLDILYANMSLHGEGIAVIGSREDAQLVKWLIENRYFPEGMLEAAIHDCICKIGREMFEWHRKNPLDNYPDHALSPEALGYAIKHGAVSSKEAASIRFDHGETVAQYIASSDGLFEKVMQQLREGTAFFDWASLAFPGDSCDCHD